MRFPKRVIEETDAGFHVARSCPASIDRRRVIEASHKCTPRIVKETEKNVCFQRKCTLLPILQCRQIDINNKWNKWVNLSVNKTQLNIIYISSFYSTFVSHVPWFLDHATPQSTYTLAVFWSSVRHKNIKRENTTPHFRIYSVSNRLSPYNYFILMGGRLFNLYSSHPA